ncbi:HAD family hydrolase, partial [Halomonas sp. GFAJ-1]|uniref:HAD family hydrolase n=1 Tax=Halomonas sp. GFAJ-1 TaxID=1118153 RepID=UPI00023A597B
MKQSLSKYKTLIFDCDGVILNSNNVKTNAFYKVALPYGEVAAQKLVDYHVLNGGVSRYKKFEFFIDSIVKDLQSGPSLEELLTAYAMEVRDGLLKCEVAHGLSELRALTSKARWLVVSGGDQEELRTIFLERGLLSFFD